MAQAEQACGCCIYCVQSVIGYCSGTAVVNIIHIENHLRQTIQIMQMINADDNSAEWKPCMHGTVDLGDRSLGCAVVR